MFVPIIPSLTLFFFLDMIKTAITRLPHRWRYLGLILTLCVIILTVFQLLPPQQEIEPEDIIQSDLNKVQIEKEERISNRLYGIDNFVSKLPRLQVEIEETEEERVIRKERKEAIKASFLHGWNGYKTYALGSDELRPLSNTSRNPFGGLGATMVDSMGTMLIMELNSEFDELLPLIKKIKVKVDIQMSVFEAIIRYVGGLLSAYELSDHPSKHILLDKAEEIGLALIPAFETAYGLPHYHFNPYT